MAAEKRRGSGKLAFCAGLVALSVFLTWWPQGLETWRYDRAAISSGEYWRLLTGHAVHVGAAHLALNLLGLLLLVELLWSRLRLLHGIAIFFASAAAINLALWFFHPDVVWYAGLSGGLHGLWAACALIGLRKTSGKKASAAFGAMLPNVIALALLVAKLWMEYQAGPVGDSVGSIGAPVVYAAHRYGALAGSCYGLLWLYAVFRRSGFRAPEPLAGDFD